MNIFDIVLPVLAAYLLGSIPTAVWVGKFFYGVDVRSQGSGNAGATNTIRVLGLKAGIPVLLIDVFKGYAAIAIAPWLVTANLSEAGLAYVLLLVAAAVVIGHTFPLFAGFRGQRGSHIAWCRFWIVPVGSFDCIGCFYFSLECVALCFAG